MSIRKQYDTDLESLKNSLTEMGRNSADAVENALEALCVADADAAAAIVKGDARINNMERDIEHRCMTLLLRQQPVAGDLRRISTAMKVVTDIERIGDHAADIAEIIPHLVTVRKEGDPAVSQAIAMGKKDNAIFLDTATLEYEYAPIHLENAKIVIACSNKKRGLGDSKYNERRSECETALAELQKVVKIDSLGELTEEQFEQYKDAIKDPVRVKRAKHAVYENQRTIKAVEALKEEDGQMFICADHGNAEQLIDEETGEPFTAHTTNPVPFILVNADPAYKLREGGCLADIAPTLIELMGMQQPAEMTGKSLLVK